MLSAKAYFEARQELIDVLGLMNSKLRAKTLANIVLTAVALLTLTFIFLTFNHNDLLRKLGGSWSAKYARVLAKEAAKALEQEESSGAPDAISTLLKSSRWRDIRTSDRGYQLKRILFEQLCENHLNRRNYQELANCAEQWLTVYERDMDASAFWYEAIRHLPGRENEGFNRLIENHRRFPGHYFSGLFLSKAYRDQGDASRASELLLETVRVLARSQLEWRIYWKTTDSAFYSVHKSRFVDLNVDHGQQSTLRSTLPGNATHLRVDLPPNTRIQVGAIEIDSDGVQKPISIQDLKLHQLRIQSNRLIAYGGIDPFFIIPLELDPTSIKTKSVNVSLRFELYMDIDGKIFSLAELLTQT